MIIRTKKDKNFTVINNTALRDKRLSWKAKGLFAYMMTNIDNWEFYVSELEKHSTDGGHATRTAIKELIQVGYLVKDIKRNKGRFVSHDYTLIEKPNKKVTS